MKQQKLTQKEFFEVLKKADCSIYDYELILNVLSSHFYATGFSDKESGYLSLAKKNFERAEFIHDFLSSRGFYE